MGFPQDLLEQADHLVRREPKKPKQASLRRAVSTAYYALFHLLVSEATLNWKRPAERSALARMFSHGTMKNVCAEKRKSLKSHVSGPHDEAEGHLFVIADTFVQMQQYRHAADYDGAATWSRNGVREKIESVEAAFRSWAAIRKTPEAQRFLAALLIKERQS